MKQTTKDTLFSEELIIHQFKDGYRFSLDPVLLANFVQISSPQSILDIGCGSGIIPLILRYKYEKFVTTVCGLEIQEDLYNLAKINMDANRQGDITLIHGDVRKIKTLLKPESFDCIYCNPPFYQDGEGRKSLDKENLIARHQVEGDIDDFICGCAYAVKNKGAVRVVYPAAKIMNLMNAMTKRRLEPKRLQFIHSYPGAEAKLLLIEGVKNGGAGCVILPPLYIYIGKNSEYSQDVLNMYNFGPAQIC